MTKSQQVSTVRDWIDAILAEDYDLAKDIASLYSNGTLLDYYARCNGEQIVDLLTTKEVIRVETEDGSLAHYDVRSIAKTMIGA